MSDDIGQMVGMKLLQVLQTDDELTFICDGGAFRAYHMQDCCESVEIHDVFGSWDDLLGKEITCAESSEDSENWPPGVRGRQYVESFTWTTQKISAGDNTVVVRWYGESNGYYSEDVHFGRTHHPIDLSPRDIGDIMRLRIELHERGHPADDWSDDAVIAVAQVLGIQTAIDTPPPKS